MSKGYGPAWFEVYVVTEGQIDEHESTTRISTREKAMRFAWMIFKNRAYGAENGRIFIQAHYCLDGQDCECIQYETDHHPVYFW